ncbi:glutathione peroxidase [Clostridiales bacterium COT073_COT-073]|nr:glutathione peroxidase [Clostridiales bacterium COT073_COT-073]
MIYHFKVKDNKGNEVGLENYKGKVLLIVNTATHCGFTPQYEGLQKLYQEYKDRGLEILDFPCNQFGAQARGSDHEIEEFCVLNYHTTFPRFAKIKVNGEGEEPLYTFLKEQKKGLLDKAIKWNFTKFLIDREGNVVGRYAPTDKPEKLKKEIEKYL